MKKVLALIFFAVAFTLSLSAQRTISGVITDNEGLPMIGANVLVSGSDVGTITDIDGSFSLSVPDGADELLVSYTGYTSQTIDITGTNTVNMVLLEGELLDEIVVTALGISKPKKALGYAVEEVKGEELEDQSETDVARLLKGRVAGVNITNTSGVAGSGTNVVIRGYSSLTGSNQPLFMVDGIPFNTNTNSDGANSFLEGGQSGSSRFADIDPNNIESISVLKGLAASVIYGEQGKNGVILITTKTGNANQTGLNISLNQSYFKTEIASLPEYQNNYGGGFHQNFGFFFSNWGPNFNVRGRAGISEDGTVDNPLSRLNDPAFAAEFAEQAQEIYPYQAYTNQERFFRDGNVNITSLNVAGGNEVAKFSSTFSYSNEDGFTPNNNLSRLNFGLGGNVKLSEKLSINASFNYVKTNQVTPPISYGDGSGIFAGGGISIFSDVFYTPRSVDLFGLPFIASDNRPVYYRSGNDILNPRWTAANAEDRSEVNRFYNAISLTYQATNFLSLNYKMGLDNYTESLEQKINRIGVSSADYSAVNNGYYRTVYNRSLIWNHNAYAGLDFGEIATGLSLDGTVGFNVREDNFDADGLESTNQIVFGFFEHSNFTNHNSINSLSGSDIQFRSQERLTAAYASFTLSYNDYLYLNLQGRSDWTSTVEKENQQLFYPSASLSFIPTELIERNDAVNYLKLRLGYGTSAGFPPPYATRNILSSNPSQFIDRSGAVVTTNGNGTYFEDNGLGATLGNPNLKPELHRELEFGIEGRFFKNKIGLDLSLYNKNTEDLITNAPLDPGTGSTSTRVNIGKINNRGIEVGLDLTPISYKDFSWNLFTNFYKYRSEVRDLGGDISQIPIEGFSNLGNFAKAPDSLDNGSVEYYPFGVMIGSVIQRDTLGNAIIDSEGFFVEDEEIGIIGDPTPDYTVAFTNTFNFKSLSLSFMVEYRKGGDFYSGTARALLARGLSKDTDFDRTGAYVLEGVRADGTPNTTMINATNLYFDNYGFGPSEVSVYDGTTIRLRDVTLSYALPTTLTDKIRGVKGVTLSLSGQNLWYNAINLPEFSNVDTDASGFSASGNGLGFEFLNGPSARRYGASLKVKF